MGEGVISQRLQTSTTTDAMLDAPLLGYFSSVSGNAACFVEKVEPPAQRNPPPPAGGRFRRQRALRSSHPTYGGGERLGVGRGAVPQRVIRFLNDERNPDQIRGVISAGNTNFGEAFCLAGDIISRKWNVPHLYRLEIFGTQDDVDLVTDGLRRRWNPRLETPVRSTEMERR